MLDPILSLAFSMHSNRGIYALLLGSGVSRSAGIPTGWEVVLELIRQLAHLRGQDCEPEPEAWYKSAFGEEPDYAKLLDAIAKSPSERNQLLRSYFEPSEAEREQGLKRPTDAHQAIASLVAGGYIRVIVTTNFDRLIEGALEAHGVTPTVISTPDAYEGALPLTHASCTVLKVHGDYLDTRIKNTPDELSHYDERFDQLLDQIFDEFGLIVCGWSAEWDVALRAAMEHCKNHRFTTYWTARGHLGEQAQKLIKLRRAEVIEIQGADEFFTELAEKVSALEDYSKPHPLSAPVAVASLKRYLVDDQHRIRRHDLVMQEAENLYSEISDERTFPLNAPYHPDELVQWVQRYEGLTEILLALIITGCYWGETVHEALWIKCIKRIATGPPNTTWSKLRLYPALLLLYGGGIAAIAGGRYSTFAALVTKARMRFGDQEFPLVTLLNTGRVMDKAVGQKLPGMERQSTPLSDYLYNVLRDPLREFLPHDTDYERCFDRFEYLLALVYVDLDDKLIGGYRPIGCFGWRHPNHPENTIMKAIELEAADAGEDWLPLKAGLFNGSLERFGEIQTALTEAIGKFTWY